MNGNGYLLDTNAIIALLQGNQQLIQLLENAEWIGISIISQLEFLAFSRLNEADILTFNQFIQRVEILGLQPSQTTLIFVNHSIAAAISLAIARCNYCGHGNSFKC